MIAYTDQDSSRELNQAGFNAWPDAQWKATASGKEELVEGTLTDGCNAYCSDTLLSWLLDRGVCLVVGKQDDGEILVGLDEGKTTSYMVKAHMIPDALAGIVAEVLRRDRAKKKSEEGR